MSNWNHCFSVSNMTFFFFKTVQKIIVKYALSIWITNFLANVRAVWQHVKLPHWHQPKLRSSAADIADFLTLLFIAFKYATISYCVETWFCVFNLICGINRLFLSRLSNLSYAVLMKSFHFEPFSIFIIQ